MEDYLWWRDGVIYQIYPRSYKDTTGDGIGDLAGIIQKLDYVTELGVDAIWLSPIYPSPDVDFGYDVSDYLAIDAKFGTMADFQRLVNETHERGLHVILDLVLNHTSDQHSWFVEARKARNNPYRDFYIWADPHPKGGPPNNWGSIFGGSAWEYDLQSGQYFLHMFYKEQPDINWRNPRVYKALLDVFRFWCDMGVDGFRLDVFNLYFKHADLPDNPRRRFPTPPFARIFDWQEHLYDYDQPEMMPLLMDIRSILDAYPERYAVGETFPDDARSAAKYSAPGYLHAAFNFEFTNTRWSALRFLHSIQRWEGALSEGQWPTYVLGNHDVVRPASRYGKGDSDARLKVAAGLLLTLRGTPYIYYGDEIGMRDIPIKRKEDVLDPIGRQYWPFFKGRDGCRSPMQWDSGTNAGFSSGEPWLPVHENSSMRNVAAQSEDPQSLLNFYRDLLRLRREHPTLQHGEFIPLDEKPRFILAYKRRTDEETLLIILNFSDFERQYSLPGGISWQILFSSERSQGAALQNQRITLSANEVIILVQQAA